MIAAHFNYFISNLGFSTAAKTESLYFTNATFKLLNHC